MNTTRKRRVSATVVSLVLVAAGLALWLAPLGGAFDPDERPAPLGLVGLTEGQMLRISVANVIGAFDPQPDPPGVCSLQVGFVDPEGTAIGDPNVFELRAGLARSFDFVATGDGSVRHYVRPVAIDLRPKEGCAAVVSGEILDRGGLNGIIVYDSIAFTDPWLSK
jgi:hypothetical protein